MAGPRFRVDADPTAEQWLREHPSRTPHVIGYDLHRCCGGGKICRVEVRHLSRKDDPATFAVGELADGGTVLIDPRAAARLPSRIGLTVRGIGRFRHLDLDLSGEQWGRLLYD